jgi:hypothetical protein
LGDPIVTDHDRAQHHSTWHPGAQHIAAQHPGAADHHPDDRAVPDNGADDGADDGADNGANDSAVAECHDGAEYDTVTDVRSCAEVRAAGKAPLYRGDPGYTAALDRNGDGIACERGNS